MKVLYPLTFSELGYREIQAYSCETNWLAVQIGRVTEVSFFPTLLTDKSYYRTRGEKGQWFTLVKFISDSMMYILENFK